ncbi:hypothetical protein ACFHW1_28425 [Micromonospora sp. LOL_014]|uniref:hypothetical protein n=1 Tax=Micromonospora sp. LOL_014 TaxID=3345415 RepID=UPI003A8A015B
MIETVELQAVARDGSLRRVKLALELAPRPMLSVELEGRDLGSGSGDNVFVALMNARLILEQEGQLLCCQGARVNVFASGMLQQFSGGRQAYVLTDKQSLADSEIVDVLAPASPDEVVTVAEQRAFVFRFFKLDDRSSGQA